MIKIKRIIILIGIIICLVSLFYLFPEELAWINQQYVLLITISVSILIPWLTSERWVEQYRLKRAHSIEFAEESLFQWKNKIHEFTEIESKVNIESFEFEAISPKTKSSIIYFQYLNEHLKNEYPIILELWSIVENHHTSVNQMNTDIKENMREAIINDDLLEQLELHPHYQIQIFERRLPPPPEYYKPDTIVNSLLIEIDFLKKYNKHWLHYDVRQYSVEIDEKQVHTYELSYSDQTIFRTLNKDNTEILKKWFSDFSERQELINKINILNEEIAQLEIYKIEFVNALDDLIWFVKLGNNLKGECPFCPPGTLATIKSLFID